MPDFTTEYERSLSDPSGFWADAANSLEWEKPWDKVLDSDAEPHPRWFVGGEMNTCFNCLDRHVKNDDGERTALIYDSAMTGAKEQFTYSELLQKVSRVAGMLVSLRVAKGDRVIIYMPMIPEAVMAMLACARIGAVHSVVFGGFAARELASRIDDTTPKVIIAGSCGLEPNRVVKYKPLLDEAVNLATHKADYHIIKQRPESRTTLEDDKELDWEETLARSSDAECVTTAATDRLYILYTSGTTSQPKGVVRDCGGHAVALQWSMKNIYGLDPGDVFWAASDLGWVVGHSYIVYAPLLLGCTTVLYEGKPVGTPDAGAFWRVISEYGVKAMFTAPTAFRAIRQADPEGEFLKNYDLSKMKTLFLAGERCDPNTLHWAEEKLDKPVIDHWWQTETGWPVVCNPMGIEAMPVKPGSPTVAMPGYDVRVLGKDGVEKPAGEMGDIVIKLPLPPGCLPTLWNHAEYFTETYLSTYPGYYLTGDAGIKDEDSYLWIMSRTDDVINVAGHRLSTGQMEEVLAAHPDVAECAVFGVADELKGQLPLGVVVLQSGSKKSESEISSELIQRVRENIGPVAAFKKVKVVKRLPKTRSGKVLRGTMVKIANGETWKVPATIDDPEVLDEIAAAFAEPNN